VHVRYVSLGFLPLARVQVDAVCAARRLTGHSCRLGLLWRRFHRVRGPFLTEIYLCHACSCQEIEGGNARGGVPRCKQLTHPRHDRLQPLPVSWPCRYPSGVAARLWSPPSLGWHIDGAHFNPHHVGSVSAPLALLCSESVLSRCPRLPLQNNAIPRPLLMGHTDAADCRTAMCVCDRLY
jgi:hypothetical protein